MLLLIENMDPSRNLSNDLEKKIVHLKDGIHANIIRLNGISYLQQHEDIRFFFSYKELHRLCGRFRNQVVEMLLTFFTEFRAIRCDHQNVADASEY